MKLDQHYFTLFDHLGPNQCTAYVSDLANVLQCSERHTKTIIRKLQENQWINWYASSGRGRPSVLTFLVTREEVHERTIKTYISEGNISKAVEYMTDLPLEQSFIQWIESQFTLTPANQQEKGLDILSYPHYYPVNTFNPMHTVSRHEGHIMDHVFNRLLRFDQKSMSFKYELAHAFQKKQNGRQWIFYIRKGVTFHDGSQLISSTVKQNIELWKNEWAIGYVKSVFDSIQRIELISDHVICFHLDKPIHLLPHFFGVSKASIIPIEAYQKNKVEFGRLPIGTGPYKVAVHKEGYLRLDVNKNYFGMRAQIDQVELYQVPNKERAANKQVNYRIIQDDSTNLSHYDWFNTEIGGTYLVVNQNKPGIHCHKEFPEILSSALDREALFSNHPYYKVGFPDSFFERPGEPLRQHTDKRRALEWFKREGFEGQTLKLTSTCLSHNAYLGFELEQIKKALKEFGIKVVTNVVNINELEKEHVMNESDLIIAATGLGEDRLLSFLYTLKNNKSFIYPTLPKETQAYVDNRLDDIISSNGSTDAYRKLRTLEKYLMDHYHIIFLYDRRTHVHIEADDRLQGVSINRYNRLRYDQLWYRTTV